MRYLAPLVLLAACGSRTGIPGGDPKPTKPDTSHIQCLETDDCPGKKDPCNPQHCASGMCVSTAGLTCDDGDPCTRDACDPDVGACVFTPVTLDLDGDGHRAPLPGTRPGDPGSCGDDCDDTSALAFPGPGSVELCDGKDNDCNGIIDDNSVYSVVLEAPLQISDPSLVEASPGGVAYAGNGAGYVLAYSGENVSSDTSVFTRQLGESGSSLTSPLTVNATTGDANGGPLVWTGDRYGLTWQDRRTGNYEIFFNTLGPDGAKLGPDVQLTNSADFSLNPSIGWNGTDFYVAYQDRRSGDFQVFGRRVDLEAKSPGPEVLLVDGFDASESPTLAVDSKGAAVAYFTGSSFSSAIKIRFFAPDLTPTTDAITLGAGQVSSPYIARNDADYVVVWAEKAPFRIFGAVVATDGSILSPRTELSSPGGFNRYPTVVGLGDRIIVTYAHEDDAPGSDYDIYFRTFTRELIAVDEPTLMVSQPGVDRPTINAFGPTGEIALLYEGSVEGPQGTTRGAFFSRLSCHAP